MTVVYDLQYFSHDQRAFCMKRTPYRRPFFCATVLTKISASGTLFIAGESFEPARPGRLPRHHDAIAAEHQPSMTPAGPAV